MIDHHCHPFALSGGPLDPGIVNLDVHDEPEAAESRHHLGRTRLGQELLTVRLAERLGCAPEDLSQARSKMSQDWPTYTRSLFADAGFEGLIMDPSYPAGAAEQLSTYADLAGCPVYAIWRLEPTVDRLIGEGASATDIVRAVEDTMSERVGQGWVGFKTVIAYRTGLGIDPDATLEQANDSLKSNEPVRRRGKACRDFVMRRALGVAAELGKPFQIHSGFGDSEIQLSDANPLLLEGILGTPEGSAATVALLHGSYPWHDELAFLAATRPNVWADVSLFNIFSPATTAERLLRILDLAPARKVVMATDGYHEPEIFWFAATILKEAWAEVQELILDMGVRTSWVDEVERLIFEDNTRNLYGI